jgi:transcriptional regulator with XRE-family HTH domain
MSHVIVVYATGANYIGGGFVLKSACFDRKRAKIIMIEKDITVQQLASAVGMHSQTLTRKMNREPEKFTLVEIHRLSEALGVSPAVLFNGLSEESE